MGVKKRGVPVFCHGPRPWGRWWRGKRGKSPPGRRPAEGALLPARLAPYPSKLTHVIVRGDILGVHAAISCPVVDERAAVQLGHGLAGLHDDARPNRRRGVRRAGHLWRVALLGAEGRQARVQVAQAEVCRVRVGRHRREQEYKVASDPG